MAFHKTDGSGDVHIETTRPELLAACDRIVVMADGRAHADLPRPDFDDPDPSHDAAHRLQAAERKLQGAIQEALAGGQGGRP